MYTRRVVPAMSYTVYEDLVTGGADTFCVEQNLTNETKRKEALKKTNVFETLGECAAKKLLDYPHYSNRRTNVPLTEADKMTLQLTLRALRRGESNETNVKELATGIREAGKLMYEDTAPTAAFMATPAAAFATRSRSSSTETDASSTAGFAPGGYSHTLAAAVGRVADIAIDNRSRQKSAGIKMLDVGNSVLATYTSRTP